MVRRVARVVGILPLVTVIAADIFMRPELQSQDPEPILRAWVISGILALGVSVSRMAVRLIFTVLLLAYVVLSGYGIGLLYVPALFLAMAATLLQMEAEEPIPARR